MTVTRQGPRQRRRHRPSIAIERESLLRTLRTLSEGRRGDLGQTDRRGRGRQHRLLCWRDVCWGRPPRGGAGAAGRRVALLARPRVIQEIEGNGLRLTSFEGLDRQVAAKQLTLSEDPRIFGDAGVGRVTVKSADTAEIADLIARHAPADAVIVSLQNGIGNVSVLRARLPGRRVLGGMVPFNVIALGEGRFHRATSGDIVVEQDDFSTASSLSVPGLNMRPTDNIDGVQWGKLLVNLNNALNALADLPLRRQLAQRGWRRLFGDQVAEGVAVMRGAGIRPVSP